METLDNPVFKNVESGQIIELIKSPFSIGRALTCDYVIENKIISRTHCSLTKSDDGWTLTDSSTNGTLVNDGHHKGEASPILKHNDEISLGTQSFTYRFITKVVKVPNSQVEKLKSQEIGGNPTVVNEVLSSCPSTPSSFDEHGISDELLNNLADNMLNNVEQHTNSAESQVEVVSVIPVNNETNQGNICDYNSEKSTISTSLKQSSARSNQLEVQKVTFHQSEASEIIVEPLGSGRIISDQSECGYRISSRSDIEVNDLAEVTSTADIICDNLESKNKIKVTNNNQRKDDTDEITQSQANSSVSTIIYSLPDEISQPVIDNVEAQVYSTKVKQSQGVDTTQVTVGSINTDNIKVSTNRQSIAVEPRDLLAESIEAVLQKYSENTIRDKLAESIDAVVKESSEVSSNSSSASAAPVIPKSVTMNSSHIHASTSVDSTSIFSPDQSMSAAPVIPTSVSMASSINANKKIRVMTVNSGIINHLKPETAQLLTTYPAVDHSQRAPTVRRVSNSEVQKILASQPTLPVIMLDQFPIIFPGPSAAGTNSTGGHNTSSLRVHRNNRNRTTTTVTANANPPSSENSGNAMFGANDININLRTSSENILGRALVDCGFVNTVAGNSLLAPDNAWLQMVEDQAIPYVDMTGEMGSSEDQCTVVPAAEHEVVIENTVHTTGEAEIDAASTTGKYHESQEPGTSKALEKKETDMGKPNNQNQYEQMEDELMCTICANLFIKAVTLGCSHSFCQYCIEQWKQKKSDCPICRNKMTSTIRTLVLDNVIEKMLENASEDDKYERKAAVEERMKIESEKVEKEKKNAKNNTRGTNSARRGRRNPSRGNQRGNAANNDNAGAGGTNNQPGTTGPNNQAANDNTRAAPVITIADSPSTTDDNDTSHDDDSSNDGEYNNYDDYYGDEWYIRPNVYYGGYGRCYSCGRRGHWANNCPYR